MPKGYIKEEWEQFKKDTNTHSEYYIEEIL